VIGAIDIGGTKIAAGAVAPDGRILYRTECATSPTQGFGRGLERIIGLLRESEQHAGERLKGIGVGSTGPIDPETGIFGTVDNLPGWKGSNLKQPLEHEFGVPVAVENDADAAALGEAAWGAGRGKRRFIYVTISTGIGGGLVFDGELYRGVDQSHVVWTKYDGVGRTTRNGLNFTERGFGVRAALGCSDRGNTAVSQLKPGQIDWDEIFGKEGARWLHTGGIFCALSESTPEVRPTNSIRWGKVLWNCTRSPMR